MPAVPN